MLFERRIIVFGTDRYGSIEPFGTELIDKGWKVKVVDTVVAATNTRVIHYTTVSCRRFRPFTLIRRILHCPV